MGETKHSPTPWKAGRLDMQTRIEGYGGKYIYDANTRYVAAAIGCEVAKWDEVVANARYIVLCVNSHEELVGALRAVIAVADRDTPEFRQARAALASVGGEG